MKKKWPVPPAPQHPKRRLQFFLDHPDHPKAKWEVFNIQNQLINKKYLGRRITPELRAAYEKEMDELDRTQGWPNKQENVPEIIKIGRKMGLNV